VANHLFASIDQETKYKSRRLKAMLAALIGRLRSREGVLDDSCSDLSHRQDDREAWLSPKDMTLAGQKIKHSTYQINI
jgi:hypothetical protein